MKLRLFLPPSGALDAPLRFALLEGRGTVLREGVAALADVPRAGEVELVLAVSRVLFARLALPRVNPATIRELLPYAVEDRLLGDPAQIHAVAARREANGETTVAVVDRAWFAHTLAALRAAGLAPAHAWSESAFLDASASEWRVVWGRERGILVDDRGVSVAFDRAGGALPLAIRLALDEAAARGSRPERVALHPEEGAPLPDLAAWNAGGNTTFTPGAPWEALRLQAPGAQAIDLMQGEFAPHASGLRAVRIPRAAVILAATMLALHVVFIGLDAWRLDRERASLEAKREALFRAAFPEAKTIIDPELQMRRNLADLRRTRGIAAGDDFLAQLTRAARDAAGPVQSIEYADGRLDVRRGSPKP